MITCLSVLTASSLLSCTSSPTKVAGGVSTSENGNLKGRVFTSDGMPAAHEKILLIDNRNWLNNIYKNQSVVVDSVQTDAQGNYSISVPDTAEYNIQIDNGIEGVFVKNIISLYGHDSDTVSLSMHPVAKYSGFISTDQGVVQKMVLSGTAYKATFGEGTDFYFPSLPQGTFNIMSSVSTDSATSWFLCSNITAQAGISTALGNIPITTSSVLIDDFSGTTGQTTMGLLLGGGEWYSVLDAPYGGTSTILQNNSNGREAFSGQSRKIVYALGDTIFPWAICGFRIGATNSTDFYDLSKMKSFSFEAKGSGKIEVRFYSRILDTLAGNNSFQFSHVLPIPSTWTSISIPIDSLFIPSVAFSQGYTWKKVCTAIYKIAFVAKYPDNNPGDTVTLWLDNISIDGMKLQDFAR